MAGFPKRKRMGLVSHAAIISHHDFFVRHGGKPRPPIQLNRVSLAM
jgi:hypothetical protein